MTVIKREYVIPLRRRTQKAPMWRRSKKAVSVLKEFVQKHMKTETVVICNDLNQKIWENGIKNPPGKVEVIIAKTTVDDKEISIVNLKSAGVDEQLKLYTTDKIKEKVEKLEKESQKKEDKKEKSDVVDAKKETTDKTEVKKEAKDTTKTKSDDKKTKEVKKDE